MPIRSSSPVTRLDALVGDGIEATVRLKHQLRLRRLGWSHALDPPGEGLWALGDPRPREGCSWEILVDGATALPEIAQAIQNARERIFITGWHLAPWFRMTQGEEAWVIGELLAEAAERVDVRILVWAGAPIPMFHPTRSQVRDSVHTLTRRTKIRCEMDPREHPIHCHHEKTVVVDDKLAFVGGIDLTDLAGDRLDSSEHPARRRLGWHDVSSRLRGPAVADVRDHFAARWQQVTGEKLDASVVPERAGDHTVQVVRTISDGMYRAFPKGEFRILEAYIRAIRSARRFIYLENQFLWAPELVDLLVDKLRNPPTDSFRLVILLPSKANNGQDDTVGQLGVLADADDGHKRVLATTIRSLTGERDDRLYVHAKAGIIDDRWLTVGSANLNAHSLMNDTEMNVVSTDQGLARSVRLRLWAEHLQVDEGVLANLDPREVVDEMWRPIAEEQYDRMQAGAPPTHRLLRLPGISSRSRRLLGPLSGLFDDG